MDWFSLVAAIALGVALGFAACVAILITAAWIVAKAEADPDRDR